MKLVSGVRARSAHAEHIGGLVLIAHRRAGCGRLESGAGVSRLINHALLPWPGNKGCRALQSKPPLMGVRHANRWIMVSPVTPVDGQLCECRDAGQVMPVPWAITLCRTVHQVKTCVASECQRESCEIRTGRRMPTSRGAERSPDEQLVTDVAAVHGPGLDPAVAVWLGSH